MTLSTGVLLSVLQFAFALGWVVYVIYLPALAAQAGIPKEAVPWILLMDQAIFVACDWAAGVHADRVSAVLGRIGPRIAAVTLASCAAFLALPFVAPLASVPAFIALTILWSATSSALRAPPLMLIGKYAAAPQRPFYAGLYLFGAGVAGALAPYLAVQLKNIDPRIPFAIASGIVALTTFGLAVAERRMTQSPAAREREWRFREAGFGAIGVFAIAIVLAALAFQAHFSLNSASTFLKLGAQPRDLEDLMPVFWIGFNLVMLPATLLAKRFGGLVVMAIAGTVAVAATWFFWSAPTLDVAIAAQFVAGGAWGTLLMSAFTAALAVGHPSRGGAVTGLLFSMLAVAALSRIAFVASDAAKAPEIVPNLPFVPMVLWGAAVVVTALLVLRGGRGTSAA